ncbi:hypothetical protein FD754_008202 [Muntiacus muntjak]|uniref:Uncharacterized protein n=1 Tax=Muntiacus muntjak TaxID=9888 RepID=A0A5N3WUZ5_MUNMU|nr:hypothetical protein FD754_008202 [Muntiacus muntjak]
MEAVPRMPMIWLDLKEAGDFHFQPAVKKKIRLKKKNFGRVPQLIEKQDILKKNELMHLSP